MKKLSIKQSALFISAAILGLTSTTASAVDMHGYFRSGVFTSSNGAQQKWAPGKIGRIGNEVDGWWDLAFMQDIYQDPDDKSKKFNVVAALEGDDQLTGLGSDQSLWMVGYTASATGYIAAAPEASLWVGKNKYQYHGIEMLDWKSISFGGPGVGVEGINAGPGKLSLAVIRLDADTTFDRETKQLMSGDASNYYGNANTFVLDARYAELPVGADSKLESLVQYGIVNKTEGQKQLAADGTIYDPVGAAQISEILTTPLRNGGFNELTLQYATGSFAGRFVQLDNSDSAYYANANYDDSYAFRAINTGEFYPTDNTIIAHALVYTYGQSTPYMNSDYTYSTAADNPVTDLSKSQSYTAVIRPGYIWNKNHKTAVEFSMFKQTNTTTDNVDMNESGNKVTLMHTLSVGTGMLRVRPEIRFYTSYINIKDNDIDSFSFTDSKTHQLSFGAQVEAWF